MTLPWFAGPHNPNHTYHWCLFRCTGPHKSHALYKAIEEGVSHMWTCSALQNHPNSLLVCDEARLI